MNRIIYLPIFMLFVIAVTSTTFDIAYAGGDEHSDMNGYNTSILDLTNEEITWIENNNQVNVVYDPNWAPFEYLNSENQVDGFTPQFVYKFEKLTGLDFVFVENIDSWNETIHALQDGSGDVAFFIAENNDRSQYLNFTNTHTTVSTDIITTGTESLNMDDLSELRVGTIRGYAIEAWLDENYPEIEYQSVKNTDTALTLLEFDKLDVYLDSYQVAKYNERSVISGPITLFNAGETGYSYDLNIGYRSDQPLLGSILQKALDSVSVTESGVSLIGHEDYMDKHSEIEQPASVDDTLPPACVRCDAGVVNQNPDDILLSQTPITLWNDNPYYKRGDIISIRGYVANFYDPNTPTITFKVIDRYNNIVEIGQIEVARDHVFTITLNTAGVMWNDDGPYKIKVYYGATSNIDNYTYVFVNDDGVFNGNDITGMTDDNQAVKIIKEDKAMVYDNKKPEIKTELSRCITINDQDDSPIGKACMNATLHHGNINSMNINEDVNSIVFDINIPKSNEMPSLELTLSDNFMTGEFVVLVDGAEWTDVDITRHGNNESNIVITNIPHTTQEIEVLGSYVIPEFGTIAVMVLLASIVAVVMITSRFKFNKLGPVQTNI